MLNKLRTLTGQECKCTNIATMFHIVKGWGGWVCLSGWDEIIVSLLDVSVQVSLSFIPLGDSGTC